MENRGQPPRWVETLARLLERATMWGIRHWLLFANLAFFLYVLWAVLAPVFMHVGWFRVGKAIYWIYGPLCHQLPERSFFLFGPRWTYSLHMLQEHGVALGSLWQRKAFIGSPELGYKMAFCERDFALYGGFFLVGVIYGLTRRRWRPLPWKWYALSLVPLALDGTTQLVGLRESTWWLRVSTGFLFALTTIWALYPRLDQALQTSLEVDSHLSRGEIWQIEGE